MASNEPVVNLQTKLVPFSSLFIEGLKTLSEDELKLELDNQMKLIVTFQGSTEASTEQLTCVSDFASVCFVFSSILLDKCKYLENVVSECKQEFQEEIKEVTQLWAYRLEQSKEEKNELQAIGQEQVKRLTEMWSEKLDRRSSELTEVEARRQVEIKMISSKLKESEEKVARLKKELEELKGHQSRLPSFSSKTPCQEETVTRGDLKCMLRELVPNVVAEVLGKSSSSEIRGSDSNRSHKGSNGLPADWIKICKTITPFNPELRPTVGIEEFLASLKIRLEVRQPPYYDGEKVAILKMVVEGSASLQIQSYDPEIKTSFDKLCEHLERDFGRFSCQEAAIEALRGKEGKQKQTEGPSEFLRRLQRLMQKAFGKGFGTREDVQLRLAFVDGLLPHIRQQIEALALTKLDDIIEKAEIFFHKKLNVRDVQVCQVSDHSELALESSQGNSPAMPHSTPPNNISRKKRGNCYNCSRPGHYARECGFPPMSAIQERSHGDLVSSLKELILNYESKAAVNQNAAVSGQ